MIPERVGQSTQRTGLEVDGLAFEPRHIRNAVRLITDELAERGDLPEVRVYESHSETGDDCRFAVRMP
ncbi:hypothetical protein KQ940_01675 [Marinobacterium sp. D7]|uniref:hypothetical protein n=1 Tax=Marinobacterium ramblicola TaxID=2849041 RepID=UPI001C2D4319|nr:hypothetical protein [Marinobacterium ramblicola]MBV1786761.1 hypothetical protein [Marinobacterium ramblicola]